MNLLGYHHPDYAYALCDYGEPVQLRRSGGWLLIRPIAGSGCRDAMGCYPLVTCEDWGAIVDDLRDMQTQLVAVWMVADPLADVDHDGLRHFFSDVCFPFKDHMVVDLSMPIKETISKHHQRYAQKALKDVEIRIAGNPESCLGVWTQLYGNLIRRHAIEGLHLFSEKSFSYQLKVPGCVVFQAVLNGRVIAMHIWYRYPDRAYYHLGASSEEGYRHYAAFGLMWEAIHFFKREGLQWLNIGAGAGTESNPDDGLTRFKKGWANAVRPAYFCGAVMDTAQYDALCQPHQDAVGKYFPAYRTGEFL